MDETFSSFEFHDLSLMQLQTPVTETYQAHHDLSLMQQTPMSENYHTINYHTLNELLNTPIQENYSNFPINKVQQPNIHFYKENNYKPLLKNDDLREVSSEKITPDSTGQSGYIINSENDKTLNPYEIKDHGKNIFPVSPAHQRRKKRENTDRIVSTTIVQNDPQAKKFESADTSITRIKFTDQWKVNNEIKSQIIHQSSSQKEKKYDGKTSSKKRQKTKDKVQVKLSKNKPIHSHLMTPSANMSRYSILQSLVQSLVDEDNVLLSKQVTVYSKGLNTSNIMFNVYVELARLAQEDQQRIITQCDPGKLESSKL